jgi:hypothetical protein
MSKSVGLGLACALLAFPNVAEAREHYYFNKSGVSRDDYTRDRTICLQLAGAVDIPQSNTYIPYNPNLTGGQNIAAAAVAGLFIGMIESARARRMSLSIERTCMADKGYDRYVVDKGVISAISKLKTETDRVDRLFELAATQQPLGTKGNE